MPLNIATQASVESDILYDSGWVDVRGDSTAQTIETFVFEEDVTIYIFGIKYIYTVGNMWTLYIPNSFNGNTASIATWKNIQRHGQASTTTGSFGDGATYTLASGSSNANPEEANNINGFALAKGKAAQFKSETGANTGHGITYRAIVVRNTAENFLERVK